MKALSSIFLKWLPFAVLATILCGLVYIVMHQEMRMGANDPQIELAQNGAALLNSGQPADIFGVNSGVDMAKTLSPFIIVYDLNFNILNSSTLLDGKTPVPPIGVFQSAQGRGENRITWEPAPGVRIAAVVVPFKGKQSGYILAGKSLREIDSRLDTIMLYVFIAWLASLASTFILVALQPSKDGTTLFS